MGHLSGLPRRLVADNRAGYPGSRMDAGVGELRRRRARPAASYRPKTQSRLGILADEQVSVRLAE